MRRRPPIPSDPAPPPRGPRRPTGLAAARIAAWVERVRGVAPWVALGFLLLTALLILGPVRDLGIDTDTADMIAEDLPWRQTYLRYKEAFPQYVDRLVVVVEGATPDRAEDARRRLAERMRAEPDLFPEIHVPGGGPFFRRHALLYLSAEELSSIAESLELYGPWLRRLERDPSLGGFLATLQALLEGARRGEETPELAPLLGAVAETFRASLDWRFHQLSWQEMLWGRRATPAERRAILVARPRLEYGSLLPASAPVERIRTIVREAGLTPANGVRVRLTGEVAMQHEELLTVMEGAGRAGVLALLMVAAILYLGLRSPSLMAASVGTLIAGLVATAGFAAFAVGHLNLISIAFAVLFIGLAIDYAIHLCLRYRELRIEGGGHAGALAGAASDVGPSVALSAVTTAVCFYAFIPTDFVGLSELGLISGTGMFIGLLVTLTLLPALLSLWRPRIGPPRERPSAVRGEESIPAEPGPLDRLVDGARHRARAAAAIPRRHPRLVLAIAAALAVGSSILLPRARFNANPLDLRDPETESVATYRELLADTAASPLTLVILEPDAEAARETADRIAGLEVVRDAITLQDFVPANQERKLAWIARIGEIMGPRPGAPAETSETGGTAQVAGTARTAETGQAAEAGQAAETTRTDLGGVRSLLDALAAFRPFAAPEARGAARYLGFQARTWLERAESVAPGDRERMRERLERALVGALPGRIDALRASLDPGGVEPEDLPPDLVERWIGPGGLHRVEVRPRENVGVTSALRRFVEGVRAAEPDATGAALVELRAGGVVVRSFRNALLYATLATVALLLLALRRVRDVLFVLLPLLLAGSLTVAFSVAAGVPFNFANIIALPLLLGVGVDNGIHMVHRARAAPPAHGDLLRTSTARAVVFSSLTTVASFGNLAFSGHPGTSSMGALLTVGMAAVLLCTLAVLPALLGPTGGERVDKAAGRA